MKPEKYAFELKRRIQQVIGVSKAHDPMLDASCKAFGEMAAREEKRLKEIISCQKEIIAIQKKQVDNLEPLLAFSEQMFRVLAAQGQAPVYFPPKPVVRTEDFVPAEWTTVRNGHDFNIPSTTGDIPREII